MNTVTQLPSGQDFPVQLLRPSDLANATSPRLSWLWHGYLAPGKVTALISPPKAGKTTLLSHLLARLALAQGRQLAGQGGQLAGLAVAPGRAIVVSEESTSDWEPIGYVDELGAGSDSMLVDSKHRKELALMFAAAAGHGINDRSLIAAVIDLRKDGRLPKLGQAVRTKKRKQGFNDFDQADGM